MEQTMKMKFIQLKIFIQNGIVTFLHVILMANISPITLIKLLLFFLTLFMTFYSTLKYE